MLTRHRGFEKLDLTKIFILRREVSYFSIVYIMGNPSIKISYLFVCELFWPPNGEKDSEKIEMWYLQIYF